MNQLFEFAMVILCLAITVGICIVFVNFIVKFW